MKNNIRFSHHRSAAFAKFFSLLLSISASSTAYSMTVTFDNYLSPTINDFTNYFLDNSSGGSAYQQTPIGGTTGGAVTAAPGNPDYFATAVFNQSFDFSSPGSKISLSMDFLYNNESLTTSRGLRLGIVGNSTANFEEFNEPSIYTYGIYSGGLDKFIIAQVTANYGTTTITTKEALNK